MVNKKKVTIFGAGIAGLTAAHELAVRGFEVTVYEPELKYRIPGYTLETGIGGMARSQFAVELEAAPTGSTMQQLASAADLLVGATVEYKIVGDDATVIACRPDDFEKRFPQLVDRLLSQDLAASLGIYLPFEGDAPKDVQSDPRYKHLASLLKGDAKLRLAEWVYPKPHSELSSSLVFIYTSQRPYAAEHGFRFFPSFYRHVFDTMGRTPILAAGNEELGNRTVLENLSPVDSLGFARSGDKVSFLVPRRPPSSLDELFRNLRKVLGELDWRAGDLNRFALRAFEYMSTCVARREGQYEHESWSDFIGVDGYSQPMREHIENGPHMMAGLRGSASDARTQGNTLVQLLIDHLRVGSRVDATLGGPTSGKWLDHWHTYLERSQEVKFVRGRWTRFEMRTGEPVPVVETVDGVRFIEDGYVIFALDLESAARVAKNLAETVGGPTESTGDVARMLDFSGNLIKVVRDGVPLLPPMRHMSGIQFYFDTEVRFWRAHTQYLDSQWGLTSIAQPQFWLRPRDHGDAYRSVLSVDIGIWNRPGGHSPKEPHRTSKVASKCKPHELAAEVWAQIREHHDDAFKAAYGEGAPFPVPRAFSLDQGLTFTDRLTENRYPFLVNETGKFPTRPGALVTSGAKASPKYELIYQRFVFAGTHMKTYTRLTSMESANESARHAVNKILEDSKEPCDRCEIWDPEDHELADFAWLRDLDAELYKKKLPHFVRILDWQELPETLPMDVLRGLADRGVRFACP